MRSRFPRAVGSQPSTPLLQGAYFDWTGGYHRPAPLLRTPATDYYWNAGVNMAYGREAALRASGRTSHARSGGDTGLKPRGYKKAARRWSLWGVPAVDVGVEAYNRAQTQMLYGNVGAAQGELGDLFNDIMGAVVPGWDQRPQALKNIVIKPDANKIMETAQRIAPNAGADLVRAANANGLQVYVNTPGGQVNVSPETAQLYYGNYQFLTKAHGVVQSAVAGLGAVSPTVWMVGGAVVFGLFVLMKR